MNAPVTGASSASPTDIPSAYAQALAGRGRRAEAGDAPRGYKIGFTNRTAWPRMGVLAPMWGTVWASTLSFTPEQRLSYGEVSLAGVIEPRIEPEVVMALAATPPDDATIDQLFDCLDWIAPGFELVCAPRAGWTFNVPEILASGGSHAHLLAGERMPARSFAGSGRELDQRLMATGLALYRGDEVVERGTGAAVLDGPLSSVQALQRLLAAQPGAPRLVAGDVITTGTWTAAWAVEPGQIWRAVFDAPLPALTLALQP